MNIAVYHNLPSGGARRALHEMVRGLTARGHVVDEFCPQTADRTFLPLAECVHRTVTLPFQPRGAFPGRVPLLTPYINALRLTVDLFHLARVGRLAAQAIDEGAYDVAFVHDCQLAQNPDVLRFLATPSVYYCHHGARSRLPRGPDGVSGLWQRARSAYYAVPKRFYPWLRERRATRNIRHADLVLTNSYFAREGLFRIYGVDSRVCYLGVDTVRFRPLRGDREPFLLSVGSVAYIKGYRFLIKALGRLPPDQRMPLVIAANSSRLAERQLIEELAREEGVDLSVRCVMDDEKLVALYNRASAFVYTPIMEPLGLAVLEAMACGAPVVAVREGGLRETVLSGHTGLLVDRDVEAFASALSRMLTNKSHAEKMGRTAVEIAHSLWRWDQTCDRLESQLEVIL